MPDSRAAPAETSAAFAKAVSALSGHGDLRVWSVIVTVFGDLARDKGDTISGALLTRLTELMGIRPEAMRVALHRLRKDGWIVSVKSGRSSNYHLTPKGLSESRAARLRIYANADLSPDIWNLLIAQPMTLAERTHAELDLMDKGYVVIAPGAYLGKGPGSHLPGVLCLDGTVADIPDWLQAILAPVDLLNQFRDFETVLDQVAAVLVSAPVLPVLEAAALRILIVHTWRRLLLRHADLPDRFFPKTWRGPACRASVAALLLRLARPDLAGLQAACQ